MTIYIDLIFFENIIMNSIIIYATSLIVKSKVKIIRLILSATIGAIYSIALYITNMKIYTSIFSKFVLSIVMMYVAFKPQKVKKLCKQTIIFYLTSFIFGGVNVQGCAILQSLDSSKESLVVTLLRQFIIILPLAFALSKMFGLNYVWFAFPVSELVALVLCIRFLKEVDKDFIEKLN